MAEKEKKPESMSSALNAAPEKRDAQPPGAANGMLSRMPVLVGLVMVLEAGILFAGFKLFGGGPAVAAGAELKIADAHGAEGGDGHGAGATDGKRLIELPVLEFRAPNKRAGRTFIYDVSIYVIAKAEFGDKVKSTIKEREALIKDRVRTIIADMDPEKLGGGSEPGLETLRRQVKHQLDEIVGEGIIEEVLVPRCIPFRTDF